ncbi:hypothetical protein [Streptomyces sp900105755]|uniref:DUF1549 domain-containing protein n=1 Tax=Streptomyces sp. 900105755 TaxID=3154389 RepID=A0ABV1TVY1_9ACTN
MKSNCSSQSLTDTVSRLTRLRTRLLGAAYANADMWTQRSALLTDQALAALADRDSAAAEDLAHRQMDPNFLNDTRILGAAVQAGIDTGHWEERREKVRAYSREADWMPAVADPDTEAKRLWASLYNHYPAIAQALATHLAGLPPTWQQDLFTRTYLFPGLTRPAIPQLPGPETAPYDDQSWEDCAACTEAQDSCSFHKSVYTGMAYQGDLIKTLLADHQTTEYTSDASRAAPDPARPSGRSVMRECLAARGRCRGRGSEGDSVPGPHLLHAGTIVRLKPCIAFRRVGDRPSPPQHVRGPPSPRLGGRGVVPGERGQRYEARATRRGASRKQRSRTPGSPG